MEEDTKLIADAPKDGTVILSDCGFVLYVDPKHWGSPVASGWVECDPYGNIYSCADNGYWDCNPKIWRHVPEWISGCVFDRFSTPE